MGITNYALYFQTPSPLGRVRGWGQVALASNYEAVFLATSPHPGAISLEQKMLLVLLSLRESQGFQELWARNQEQVETDMSIFYYTYICQKSLTCIINIFACYSIQTIPQ